MLDLEGCIVTINAMGMQTEIAEQIREQEADYVLALKGNQGTLHHEVHTYFEEGQARRWRAMPVTFEETTAAALLESCNKREAPRRVAKA